MERSAHNCIREDDDNEEMSQDDWDDEVNKVNMRSTTTTLSLRTAFLIPMNFRLPQCRCRPPPPRPRSSWPGSLVPPPLQPRATAAGAARPLASPSLPLLPPTQSQPQSYTTTDVAASALVTLPSNCHHSLLPAAASCAAAAVCGIWSMPYSRDRRSAALKRLSGDLPGWTAF